MTLVLITVLGLMTGCGSSGTSTQTDNSQDPIETVSNMDELLRVVQPRETDPEVIQIVAQTILDTMNEPESKKGQTKYADRTSDVAYTRGAMDVMKRWEELTSFTDLNSFLTDKFFFKEDGVAESIRMAFSQENLILPNDIYYQKVSFPLDTTIEQAEAYRLNRRTGEIEEGSSCGYALFTIEDHYAFVAACFKIIEK